MSAGISRIKPKIGHLPETGVVVPLELLGKVPTKRLFAAKLRMAGMRNVSLTRQMNQSILVRGRARTSIRKPRIASAYPFFSYLQI